MSLAPVLAFLANLRANNHTEWFRANRPAYEAARARWSSFIRDVHAQLKEVDPTLRDLDPTKALFRINRDIRFSRDKSPYKIHFGAVLAPGGTKDPGPVYYIQLQPGGESGLAGGIWQPASDQLKRIRQEIDYNGPGLRQLITDPAFTAVYGDSFFRNEQLTRVPAGYPADHPEADLLRLKGFTGWHPVTDEQASAPDFAAEAVRVLSRLTPLNNWLREALVAG